MFKKLLLRKGLVSSTIVLTLILISSFILPVYAHSNESITIFKNNKNINIVEQFAVGGLQQYYPERPHQESSLIVTQFTGNTLTLSASATPGTLGHADYVIIRIKQRDVLGYMKTIYSGTIYTNGYGKLIIGRGSIKAYADIQITADVRSYNGTICTGNVAISASSSN